MNAREVSDIDDLQFPISARWVYKPAPSRTAKGCRFRPRYACFGG